ncbi:hypothetical protein N7454_006284 [Penicillium verhagenii]|nr:hypothetical protein N7454_006284 [Penicillium verhagenii]
MLTFVRLNDAQVLWAYCMLNAVGRYNRFPFDFDSKGEVRMDRMPMSPAPIVWWKGQPWTPVFKGIYVLCGRWQLSAGYQVGGNIRNAASEIHVRIMHATPSAVREACKHIISVDDRSTPRPSLLDLGRMAVVVPELTANAFNIRDDGKIGAGKVMDMLIDSSCSHNPSGEKHLPGSPSLQEKQVLEND